MVRPRLEAVPSPRQLRERIDGVITGDQLHVRMVPVHDTFRRLLPAGGIPTGTTLGVTGDASLSLAFALVVEAVTQQRWLGVVGGRHLGLAALATAGVPLERVVVFDLEAPAHPRDVVARIINGFDLLIVSDPRGAVIADPKIAARVRERGAVLVGVDPTLTPNVGRHRWGNRPDLVLDATTIGWDGVGQGAGSLTGRTVEISVAGRRVGQPIVERLWLPGPGGQAMPIDERYAGSDVDALLDAEDRERAKRRGGPTSQAV